MAKTCDVEGMPAWCSEADWIRHSLEMGERTRGRVDRPGASVRGNAYNHVDMRFEELLRGCEVVRRAGPNAEVGGVEYDSRRVAAGSLFLAMQGGTTDGNRYIGKAMAQGAGAIVTDSAMAFGETAQQHPETAIAEIPAGMGRRAMAVLAAKIGRASCRE